MDSKGHDNKKPALIAGFKLAAQFALTSRAYHNLSTYLLTLQLKSVAICAERVTKWCVKDRFCKTNPCINATTASDEGPVRVFGIKLVRHLEFALSKSVTVHDDAIK